MAKRAYVAIAPCGCCHAIAVDGPEEQKENAKSVADWIKRGSRVENVELEQAKGMITFECPHDPKWGR